MTAKKGTLPFFSEEAQKSEKRHKKMIMQILSEIDFQKFLYRKAMRTDALLQRVKYSRKKNGKYAEIRPDGGFLLVGDKLVGVAENKYQKSNMNAVERALKYLAIKPFRLEPSRIFLSCYGKGFNYEDNSSMGSTGVFLDMAIEAGIWVVINPTDEEFERSYREWLVNLK